MLPIALILAMFIVFLAWNRGAGLRWTGPDLLWLAAAILPCAAISAYAGARGSPRLSELSLLIPFYLVFPVLGVQLSYLGFTFRRPLIDGVTDRFDRSLGFSWEKWGRFVEQAPGLKAVLFAAYESHFYQIIGSVLCFGLLRHRSRNTEMLFILVFALALTLVVCALFPTLGPKSLLGQHTPYEAIIRQIRAGQTGPFPLIGAVSFPSYHTVIALTLIYCHRDLRWTWLPVLLLNLTMLMSIPTIGEHTLADMAGGAIVTLVSIAVSRRLYHTAQRAGHAWAT